MLNFKGFLVVVGCLFVFSTAHAQEEETDPYNPFIDYSENFESPKKEKDIHFFQNGRYLSLTALFGARSFTKNLARYFKPSTSYGLAASYFFDLRFALHVGYTTGRHSFTISSIDKEKSINGIIDMSDFFIGVKYYFNTQNLVKHLSQLNPYITTGFDFVSQTGRTSDSLISKTSSTGGHLGGGIEIAIGNNDLFLGLHGNFKLINFPDENQQVPIGEDNEKSQYPLDGDFFEGFIAFGTNF